MANYMFILRSTEKKYKVVCPECAKRGEVLASCHHCCGAGVRGKTVQQYYVQERPIEIVKTDRDPKTGVLRYWESVDEFFYETVTPKLNKYVPEVPYGVHLCHDTRKSADTECERLNNYLKKTSQSANTAITLSYIKEVL